MNPGVVKRHTLADTITNVITGVERSPFILIEDNYEHSGLTLFKTILKYQIESRKAVKLLCLENPPAIYRSVSDPFPSEVDVCDGYSDPLKWNSSSLSEDGKLDYFDYLNFCTDLQKQCHVKKTLMIDSLSHLLLNTSVHQVYKMLVLCLKRNNSSFVKIVANVHFDVHQESVLLKLEHLASTVLRLSAESPTTCTITHKLPSGKTLREERYLLVTEDMTFYTRDIETEGFKHQTIESDPTADLTFNLNLKDDERSARSDLVLPYMKSSGEGSIYYQPEDDSEDPDDDLDV